MSLHLTDDVQAVDQVLGVGCPDAAGFFDQLCLIQLFFCGDLLSDGVVLAIVLLLRVKETLHKACA